MNSSNVAYITPALVKWARERAGLSHEEVAARLRVVKPNQVHDWENGKSLPTLPQAENLATRLRIPLAVLFLSNPPPTEIPLPDLRTVSRDIRNKPSAEFLDVVNDAVLKQRWFREYQEQRGSNNLAFVASLDLGSGYQRVASAIREALGIDNEFRNRTSNWEDFLRKFIQNVESLGVLVMRSGIVGNDVRRKLDVKEFRGFAISDKLAPLVFINSRDAKAAQIFTLAHELAHIWVGSSGISNPNPQKRSVDLKNDTERFCNTVAAELLVPAQELARYWNPNTSNPANVGAIAVRFRISPLVALRRAYDLGRLDSTEFLSLWEAQLQKFKSREAEQPEERGGNFWNSFNARNGSNLTDAVLGEVRARRVLYTNAARLLSVRVRTIEKLVKQPSSE